MWAGRVIAAAVCGACTIAIGACAGSEPLVFHSAHALAHEIGCRDVKTLTPKPSLPSDARFNDAVKCHDITRTPIFIYTFDNTARRDRFYYLPAGAGGSGEVQGDAYLIYTDAALAGGLGHRLRATEYGAG